MEHINGALRNKPHANNHNSHNSVTLKLISQQDRNVGNPRTSTGKSIRSSGCTGHFRFTTKPVLGIRRRLRTMGVCCNRFGVIPDGSTYSTYSMDAAKNQYASVALGRLIANLQYNRNTTTGNDCRDALKEFAHLQSCNASVTELLQVFQRMGI